MRRTLLKAGTVGAGLLALGGSASASSGQEDENGGTPEGDSAVDQPDGFEIEVLQGHTPFPDELAATFSLSFTGTGGEDEGPPIGAHAHLDDDSTMIVAEVTWEPGGTSGWHRHPGVVFVSVLEGDVEVTWERDCVPRTYAEGEGFFDPGVIHNADNLSEDEGARAYAVFLGIPDGEPATIWVEPVDC
ncbi:cupin domain-containing protein [Halorientalis halophila]|uniref:cupin domain-containing protein n=1 Tax=Halorientalis halophila TaxID=3108499 RepID=UPI00300A17AA